MSSFRPSVINLQPDQSRFARIADRPEDGSFVVLRSRIRFWKLQLFFCCILLFQGCTTISPVTPAAELPPLQDDLQYRNLSTALDESLAYLASRPPNATFSLGERQITANRLIRSLQTFQQLIHQKLPDEELQAAIKARFTLVQVPGSYGFNPERTMLVTGYYQPIVQGSLTRNAFYRFPLYSVPPDLIVRKTKTGTRNIGRIEKGTFVPYWTRKQIDREKKLRGCELVWLKDPLDAFFLHVQGSGYIQLPDKTLRGVRFASRNGQPYRSIGKYMVKTGKIKLETASMETIRKYMAGHPDEIEEILFTNPSYIFFKWSDSPGAVGNLGCRLTPGRSIAADQSLYPAGGLGFLQSRIPVFKNNKQVGWKPVHRFVLVQDSGSAIHGPGRTDLFLGSGDEAGRRAGAMKEPGRLFVLILKEGRK
jgi:membrane-bound lytic murein transglycosylase A